MENKKNVVGLAGRIAGEIEKQPDIYGARNLSRLYLEIYNSFQVYAVLLLHLLRNNPHIFRQDKNHDTEVSVKVPSAFTEGYFSFVPTICWKEYAEWAAMCREGFYQVLKAGSRPRFP